MIDPSHDDIKRDFITALRIIYREGLSDAFAHLSVRSRDGDEMMFMPRKSPALVQSEDLFFVDFEKAVPQSSLHQAIYKARPDVKAVFHFHSPAVILLSVVGQTLRPMHNYSAVFYEGVPLYTGTGQVESPARAGENPLEDARSRRAPRRVALEGVQRQADARGVAGARNRIGEAAHALRIAAADRHGIAMIITGKRQFRH